MGKLHYWHYCHLPMSIGVFALFTACGQSGQSTSEEELNYIGTMERGIEQELAAETVGKTRQNSDLEGETIAGDQLISFDQEEVLESVTYQLSKDGLSLVDSATMVQTHDIEGEVQGIKYLNINGDLAIPTFLQPGENELGCLNIDLKDNIYYREAAWLRISTEGIYGQRFEEVKLPLYVKMDEWKELPNKSNAITLDSFTANSTKSYEATFCFRLNYEHAPAQKYSGTVNIEYVIDLTPQDDLFEIDPIAEDSVNDGGQYYLCPTEENPEKVCNTADDSTDNTSDNPSDEVVQNDDEGISDDQPIDTGDDSSGLLSEDGSMPSDEPSCFAAAHLGVWLDKNDDGKTDGETYLGRIYAYKGQKSHRKNYDYYSYSAHPIIGPTPIGFESHIFFYEHPDGFSFNFYHNQDEGGSKDNSVKWLISTANNERKDRVILSDDKGELKELSSLKNHSNKYYLGKWRYWSNTDGGVIGPFRGSEFEIKVKVSNTGDLKTATFYSADGNNYSLMSEDGKSLSSFIIKYEGRETCN